MVREKRAGSQESKSYLLEATVVIPPKNTLEEDSIPLGEPRDIGPNIDDLAGCIRPKDGRVVSLVFTEENALVPDLPVNLQNVSISRKGN